MIFHKISDPSFFTMLLRHQWGKSRTNLGGTSNLHKKSFLPLAVCCVTLQISQQKAVLVFHSCVYFVFFFLLLCNAKHTGREVCVFGCHFTLKTNNQTNKQPPSPTNQAIPKVKLRLGGERFP